MTAVDGVDEEEEDDDKIDDDDDDNDDGDSVKAVKWEDDGAFPDSTMVLHSLLVLVLMLLLLVMVASC